MMLQKKDAKEKAQDAEFTAPSPTQEVSATAAETTIPVPGRTGKGQRMHFQRDETIVTNMSDEVAAARKEVVDTYNRKSDILGHYRPDWEQSNMIPNISAKYTTDISKMKLSNTLDQTMAQQHKDTRAAKLVMDNTNFLAFEKVPTTNGWNASTECDNKDRAQKLKDSKVDALKNTQAMTGTMKKYTSPTDTYKANLEAARDAKRQAAAAKAAAAAAA